MGSCIREHARTGIKEIQANKKRTTGRLFQTGGLPVFCGTLLQSNEILIKTSYIPGVSCYTICYTLTDEVRPSRRDIHSCDTHRGYLIGRSKKG